MKPWYTSKTLWFNAIVAALAAAEGLTGLLQPYVGQGFYAALCFVLPVGNAILRVVTTQGVSK